MKERRENEVAKILIKLPTLIRKFSLAWGCKKKRSSIALHQPFSFASLKRYMFPQKREQYLQIIEQLTKDNHLLYEQINNVKCYFHKLKDFNFKLKARKQELSRQQLQLQLQLAHHPPMTAGPAQISGVASFSSDVCPNGIPDLNLPLHESFMTMDLSW
ncbi:hypothetical protein Fmac_000242 [Flemingia macrophylla]|uniref:Uncharacterized protein n=1 Tax=Flemingia macrophylla TaxID=520843 RepID=A0ABD1NDP6_9FABA